MLSRIFWIGIAGIALIAGMAWQDGDRMFGWGDHDGRDEVTADRDVHAAVDRAVERGFDRMQVVDSDGHEVDVPAETKRAMANAVGRLVKAETELALSRIGDEQPAEVQAAQSRRDQARAEVDRLKAEIERLEQAGTIDSDALRQQIQQEVREEVRSAVRESVRN